MYLKEIPYCATVWKFAFQTKVTSHAFVACSLHDRKAEMALPPTIHALFSSAVMIAEVGLSIERNLWGRGDIEYLHT